MKDAKISNKHTQSECLRLRRPPLTNRVEHGPVCLPENKHFGVLNQHGSAMGAGGSAATGAGTSTGSATAAGGA